MALFARELRYVAYDMDLYLYFLTLVGLFRKKTATAPIRLVLVRYVHNVQDPELSTCEMARIASKEAEEKVMRRWPSNEKEIIGRFSGSEYVWEKAPLRMLQSVVGGWYESVPWMKVSMPKRWRKRRTGRTGIVVRTENVRSITEARKLKEIAELKEKCSRLWRRRRALNIFNAQLKRYAVSPLNQEEYARLGKCLDRLRGRIRHVATARMVIESRFLRPFSKTLSPV